MELKQYMHMQIEGLDRGLKRVINGLTQEEIAWRPASGCNSIGLILFHLFRSEDSIIQDLLKGKKELWEAGRWYQQLNLDPKDTGGHYTVEQVNAFTAPALEAILKYGEAVRAATIAYVDALKMEDLDKTVKMPWGEMSVAMMVSLIVEHAAQHIGEMSYLRGLQRGMDK